MDKVAPKVLFDELDGRFDLLLQPLGSLDRIKVGQRSVEICALGVVVEEV